MSIKADHVNSFVAARSNRFAKLWRALKALDAAIHFEPADTLIAESRSLAARVAKLEGAAMAPAIKDLGASKSHKRET